MLSLTRIFLHNWHRFTSQMIEVQDSLYFTGHNASGKSTILDAMQVVLLADLNLIKFNSSAQEKSKRTLDGFVRGKIFETRWLHPGNTIGYIALEFTDDKTKHKITLGCCIEASLSLGPNGERGYFIIKDALDVSLLISQGHALTRLELKKVLQRRPKARYYDIVKEYQEDMLDALGGLNRRFFDLFQRALSFKPITRIDEFVQQWLLSPHPLDLQNLQHVIDRLDDLRKTAKVVKDKLDLLDRIASSQRSYQRFKELQAQYEVLHALLNEEIAKRERNNLQQQLSDVCLQLNTGEERLRQIDAALRGAQAAKTETEKCLYGLDVVKQRDIWEKEIARKTIEADSLRKQRNILLQSLRNIANALRNTENASFLEDTEQQVIRLFVYSISQLTSEEPPNTEIVGIVNQVITVLGTALEKIGERIYNINSQSQALRESANILSSKIEQLDTYGASIFYPDSAEALRNALEPVVGSRPRILCELVEIPDERWQIAVEAMLGHRRFNLIVPPETYEEVLRYLGKFKANPRFHDARVLDLERARRQERHALPHSLAFEAQTDDPYLRAYLNSILGAIITCQSEQEVRRHDRAITPDLVYYSEWAVQVISSRQYERWFVGKRASRSQREACERELFQIREALLILTAQHTQATAEKNQIDYKGILERLQPTLEDPPDERPLLTEIANLQSEMDALDMSVAKTLEVEIKRLESIISNEVAEQKRVLGEQGQRINQQQDLEEKVRDAITIVSDRMRETTELISKNPNAEIAARMLFEEQCKQPSLLQVTANALKSARSFTTQTNDALKELRDLRLEYNITYQFAGLPDVIDDIRYAQEQERLSASQLPMYTTQIEQAQQEADQELREHVLHNLRERIQYAKDELKRMNDALRPLTFRGDRYQFCWEVANHVREYYRLIDESQFLGSNALFESSFYEQNKDAFEQFYTELIRAGQNDVEKKVKAELTDYRTYLKYDIEVKHSDGSTSLLSNIMGETSGGETQTPFYLAIAASFVQLYRMMDQKTSRHMQPTIRLAVFDEAFNRMDQERIGVTLDMFRQFKLQIITATPLERCEYLVPKMCTNLVVTRAGEEVLIDEYRNYAAKLEEKYAE